MAKFKVTEQAKRKAKNALEKRSKLPKSKQFGITKKEAKKLGINSGVERAKQIIRSKNIPEKDAKRVCAFYQRFKNCKTEKCEGSLDLWGGRSWSKRICSQLKKKN